MTVVQHPMPGTVVRLDLSEGFRPPEMTKRRPAIILSPPLPGRQQLCTVVPLSTTAPKSPRNYHMQVAFDPCLPRPYTAPKMWVKADMLQTVAFHRLRLLFVGMSGGQRTYDIRVLDAETMISVRNCVRAALGL